jgi:hypothetical protein
MKYQKKPEERKSNLTPACSNETCMPERNPFSESFLFHYSIIENYPIHYEYGSNPVRTVFTVSAFSGLPIKVDLTMKDSENYFKCAEKFFRLQTP